MTHRTTAACILTLVALTSACEPEEEAPTDGLSERVEALEALVEDLRNENTRLSAEVSSLEDSLEVARQGLQDDIDANTGDVNTLQSWSVDVDDQLGEHDLELADHGTALNEYQARLDQLESDTTGVADLLTYVAADPTTDSVVFAGANDDGSSEAVGSVRGRGDVGLDDGCAARDLGGPLFLEAGDERVSEPHHQPVFVAEVVNHGAA